MPLRTGHVDFSFNQSVFLGLFRSNPDATACPRLQPRIRRRDHVPAPVPDRVPAYAPACVSNPLAMTPAWISAAPSKMLRMRASTSTRLMGYSSA